MSNSDPTQPDSPLTEPPVATPLPRERPAHSPSLTKCRVRDEIRWRVRWHETGRIKRKFFTGREAAEAFVTRLRGETITARTRLAALPQDEQETLWRAYTIAREKNLNLVDLLTLTEHQSPVQAAPAIKTVIARDTGMKYAVLTTKHVAGHSLWPTKLNGYHVGTSGNKTDVVAAFLKACERRGVKPGFYYCAWDNHNRLGSLSPNIAPLPFGKNPSPTNRGSAYVTQAYLDFQWAQITELMDTYGPVTEWWLDIPHLLPREYRERLYAHIAQRQPEAIVMFNHGLGDGSELIVDRAWPTDLITIERFLPNSATGHVQWRNIDGKNYYIPGEVCDPIGNDWFYTEYDHPRSDAELLGMYLTSTSRGANLLLDVGPDKHGLIPDRYQSALVRLRKNLDKLGLAA